MILPALIQRLYAALLHGPAMNARPQNSRQRLDWLQLSAFQGTDPQKGFITLLGDSAKVDFPARVPPPTNSKNATEPVQESQEPETETTEAATSAEVADLSVSPPSKSSNLPVSKPPTLSPYRRQTALLLKLREMAEDARDYFNDFGENVLAIGFPLLSMPAPGEARNGGKAAGGRILAPLAFIQLNLTVLRNLRPGVAFNCSAEGVDRLVPNSALLAWLEQQTGHGFEDVAPASGTEGVEDPGIWPEIAGIMDAVATALDLPPDRMGFAEGTPLVPVPPTTDLPPYSTILPCAVVGLFPLQNQALLRDMLWMSGREDVLKGPVGPFIKLDSLECPVRNPATPRPSSISPSPSPPFLLTRADPCQAAAVRSAREEGVLVIHGPPGTGKSQTIANIIGDHLARGERVLFVCDKRSALDVVKFRLDALGLGHLCGIVHDAGRDRRELYLGLRQRLDNLADSPTPADPSAELEFVNRRLAQIHQELEAARVALHDAPAQGAATGLSLQASFHDLVGRWLALENSTPPRDEAFHSDQSFTTVDLEQQATLIDECLRRARRAGLPTTPFREGVGISLDDYLKTSTQEWQRRFDALIPLAPGSAGILPATDYFAAGRMPALPDETLATKLDQAATLADDAARASFARYDSDSFATVREQFRQLEPAAALLEAGPLDAELLFNLGNAPIEPALLNQRLLALEAFAPIADSFWKIFSPTRTKQAAEALAPLGLAAKGESVQRGLAFYRGLRARLLLSANLTGSAGVSPAANPDHLLKTQWRARAACVEALSAADSVGLGAVIRQALPERGKVEALAAELKAAAARSRALAGLKEAAGKLGVFTPDHLANLDKSWRADGLILPQVQAWRENLPQLEEIIRLHENLASLPPSLRFLVGHYANAGVELTEALPALERIALENEIRARIAANPELARLDGERIEAAFSSYGELIRKRESLSQAQARFQWETRQRDRLLATTGSRLNSLGASLRQRLFVRGNRALKLRQMIATGAGTEGGDPLFELCPVWMAAPSTVAQMFPREPFFDVVVFDEASQCRLEEALPVLLRGRRVVIAGDQKQLPPTRFFESGVVEAADTAVETLEELFEQQQSEAEDLLTAALNLEVREAFLDVHYRSRDPALIAFSNAAFYDDRLQAVPAHPSNLAESPSIMLHRSEGVYEKRTNPTEAGRVAELVAELLAQPAPPSLGVACFNITQRECILNALDARAATDEDFAKLLAEARVRRGGGSFEGLFVKNLENVQGDERDVLIISTTFGPDAKGVFRRNFGPLSQNGGARRLNVLVTRARQAVHVVTSIPRGEYAAAVTGAMDDPQGRLPNGRILLYAYIKYAEDLGGRKGDGEWKLGDGRLEERPCRTPSLLVMAIGSALNRDTGLTGTIYWGNEGFRVDAALMKPNADTNPDWKGILADFSRYTKAPDPIAWDHFRTEMLRAQGWRLERLWSTALFRDSERELKKLEFAL